MDIRTQPTKFSGKPTAFAVADRFSQNPEAYLPYLKSRQKFVIAGSFMGIGSTATRMHKAMLFDKIVVACSVGMGRVAES